MLIGLTALYGIIAGYYEDKFIHKNQNESEK